MMQLSACIEWLFADEAEDIGDRIRLAKASDLDAVEFWFWSNKDLDAVAAALSETGLPLSGFVAEPIIPLTDPANHAAFLEGLKRSVDVARRLGAKVLIAQAGNDLPGVSRTDQRAALTACLAASADILKGSGIRLGVEPLNTLIDHQGYFLPSTVEALDIVDDVARPEIGIVYDLYHSLVMGEVPEEVVAGRVDRIIHVHVADHPGRNDPGTGNLDLKTPLAWLFANGYSGRVGLEYRPAMPTSQGIEAVRRRLG
ncbi:TIM barrel protein [Devosia sp. XJ19-1]|uniref:TIM barrel protein n=1 Tax=Devosia ureilytica TaxID=2952754 RepID=UPI0020C80349|nr:TIM barrel protein [Devosia ureilytica]MCP8884093.1 TIM barrel protein [Devosia ureilytica]